MTHSIEPSYALVEFIKTFFQDLGLPREDPGFHPLAGDGSTRTFLRVSPSESGPTFVAMENSPSSDILREENQSYLTIGRHLFDKGLPLPEIHRVDLHRGWFIMEDFGDRSLQDAVTDNKNRIPLYEKVVELLLRLQVEGSDGFQGEWCYQTERYDSEVMRRYESGYFREAFLSGYLGLKQDWSHLDGPFDYLAETAGSCDDRFFLHRDFQSRNIMITDNGIGIIDWQGGRFGPLPYDPASLLIDPYTGLSSHDRERIYHHYLLQLRDYQPAWVEPFERYFPYLAIQRNLQILGAFAFLTRVQGKGYFEAYISPALQSLHGLLDDLGDPKLKVLKDLVNSLGLTPKTPGSKS